MSRLRFNWAAARGHLRNSCSPLAAFIEDFGVRRYQVRKDGGLFQALARAIAYQQLSGKAAGTIHGRFEGLFADSRPNATDAIGMSIEQLRSVGLSQAKSLSIKDLAAKSLGGELPSPRKMGGMDDAEIIDALCTVRGIGPWTAQVYLIFNLGRPDVMPATDLGVQKGVRNVYGLESLPVPDEVMEITRHLAPYRSAASWYFWRASETVTP